LPTSSTDEDDDNNGDESDDVDHKRLHIPVDIGPAWLLLSHGAFIAAIVGGSNTAYNFLVANPALLNSADKGLAIMQAIGSLLIGSWTIYAISGTWRENMKLKHPVYGNLGFTALIFIVLYLMAIAVWTIVTVAIHPVP
jgi:hypothetical protein